MMMGRGTQRRAGFEAAAAGAVTMTADAARGASGAEPAAAGGMTMTPVLACGALFAAAHGALDTIASSIALADARRAGLLLDIKRLPLTHTLFPASCRPGWMTGSAAG
jgi:hypothetical protein